MSCGQHDHCCWFKGEVCKHLVENAVDGYRYSCGLKLKYGTWDAVGASDEYREVQPLMDEAGYKGLKCYEWPPEGVRCNTCG